jgi:hypothetical protein
MGLNPGRRGGKPATNRLSYGAAERLLLHRNTMAAAYENLTKHMNIHSLGKTESF